MSPRSSDQIKKAAVVAFVHDLVAVVLNRGMHHATSRWVTESLQELLASLRHAADVGVEMPLQLQFCDDLIHYEGRALNGPSLQAAALLQSCREREIAMLSFAPGLELDEANRCLDLLLLPHNRAALLRNERDLALQALGIRNVRFTLRNPGDPANRRVASNDMLTSVQRYQQLADSLLQNHARALRDQELEVQGAAGAIDRTVSDLDEPSTLLSLATQDDVDRFTIGHSVRVALLALQVARAIGASREQLVQVGTAALLHDIGKSKVPQEILWKRGRLSPEEWDWMKQHPRLGAEILLAQHTGIEPSAVGAAFCHHMGPTGAGYPNPSLPVAPSGTSRLIRVCDVFEALTSVRPYKRALTPVEAYAVMFRTEQDFDPNWLRRFVLTLGLFPTGSRVMLDDGANAIVLAQGETPEHPVVRLLTGPGGADLISGQPDQLRMGQLVEGKVRRIAAVSTQERCLRLPEFDATDPQILTTDATHACMSTTMLQNAATVSRSPG